jgi:ketosteroid isomerase-like protein
MKRMKLIDLTLAAISLLVPTIVLGQATKPSSEVPSQQVQQALIALDKQWGEAGSKGDSAALNKILADDFLAIGPKGEALGKQEQIAATPTAANVQNASYAADEYKFEMLIPDVVVMTHRATIKGTHEGKEVAESHRSLHVFQKRGGQWQVVANAQLPIAQ